VNVVIPFVPPRLEAGVMRGLIPATEAYGRRVGATFVDLSGSDFAYYELFKELWATWGRFIGVPSPSFWRAS
jgi:hypothetical protein